MFSPRRSRPSAPRVGELSRRLSGTTRTRVTASAGTTGTRASTRPRTVRSGGTSRPVARRSAMGARSSRAGLLARPHFRARVRVRRQTTSPAEAFEHAPCAQHEEEPCQVAQTGRRLTRGQRAGACSQRESRSGKQRRGKGALAQASKVFGGVPALRVGGGRYGRGLVLSGGPWGERIGPVWNSAFICR